jgi:hypothetical protein
LHFDEATRLKNSSSILGVEPVISQPARVENCSRFSLPGAPNVKSSTMKL